MNSLKVQDDTHKSAYGQRGRCHSSDSRREDNIFHEAWKKTPGGMNGLVITLAVFSTASWMLFNFSFTSNLSGELLRTRRDLFVAILTLSIICNVFALLFFVSFFRASSTDPGRIPDSPPWNQVDPNSIASSSLESKKAGGPRFCRYERRYKPDRAHHCSQYALMTSLNSYSIGVSDAHYEWTITVRGLITVSAFGITSFSSSRYSTAL